MRVKLILALVVTGALVAACAPSRKAANVNPYDKTVDAGCYTVDLFTPTNVTQPTSDVPVEWHGFLGKWGGGAWEGKWCHDLYVLSIEPDGKVDVISAHAPFPEWGREATAFRRQGYITKEGALRLLYKNVIVEYRLENGRLLGIRKEGPGRMRIKLAQQNLEA